MTDRETIESALKRVHSGELTPAEATELLLAREQGTGGGPLPLGPLHETDDRATGSLEYESIESLVTRLGNPPARIVEAWCQALGQIACQHEQETDQPIPPIVPAMFGVTHRANTVFWNGHRYELGDRAIATPSQESLDRIEKFRENFRPPQSGSPQADIRPSGTSQGHATGSEPTAINVLSPESPNEQETSEEEPANPRSDEVVPLSSTRRSPRTAIVLSVFGVCAALIGAVVLYHNSRSLDAESLVNESLVNESLVNESLANESLANESRSDPFALSSIPSNAGPAATASPESAGAPQGSSLETIGELETLESMTAAESSPLSEAAIDLEPSFSLDDLMPPVAEFVASSNSDPDRSSAGSPPDPTEVPDGLDISDASDGTADEKGEPGQATDVDVTPPDESPQPTRTSPVMSVALPPIDQVEAAVLLSESAMTGLKLDFPFDVPLVLGGADEKWEVRDSRKDIVIGEFTRGSNETSFHWSDRAGESPLAVSLSHGRITDDDGNTVFLRPVIEADPLPLRLSESDAMPTWNLRYPIPPRAARVSLEFELPDEIEHAWIEPIDPESLRRGRGLAVLTPEDGESVALGIRFDLRCSRKLSCRTRFAARLDPSMPWQVVSTPILERVADQLVHQAMMISQESTRLSAVYDNAGTSGRKILRAKRDRNDAIADSVRAAAERVAQLQTLIAAIEAEASLKLRVWIEWPDTTQEVLTMQSESPDPNAEDNRGAAGEEEMPPEDADQSTNSSKL